MPAIGPKPGAAVDDELLVSGFVPGASSARAPTACPAYVVLHDSMLRDLAATRPTTRHELAAVKGFGPARIERYGDEVLELVGSNDRDAASSGLESRRLAHPAVPLIR